jgi:hypothetical protein
MNPPHPDLPVQLFATYRTSVQAGVIRKFKNARW